MSYRNVDFLLLTVVLFIMDTFVDYSSETIFSLTEVFMFSYFGVPFTVDLVFPLHLSSQQIELHQWLQCTAHGGCN